MKRFHLFIIHFINLFTIVTLVFLSLYFIIRIVLFFLSGNDIVESILGFLLIASEIFILLHSFGFLIGILRAKINIKPYAQINNSQNSSVAVVVAARHEPRYILERTFLTLKYLNYPNKFIYFLDDSSLPEFKQEAQEIAKKFDAQVFSRENRHGAKAGILNDFINQMQETYLAVFDADQQPMPDFLRRIVPLLENDEKLAFVQTPQFYSNSLVSPIARGACIQQAIFYEYICEAKSSVNSMFCCGTNVVFRKSALDKVSGFDETSITEDFATSLRLHISGFHSLYYNQVSAFGMAPENLPAYIKQQSRWATGSIQVFQKTLKRLFCDFNKMSPIQWLEYLLSGSYYFSGWAFFILMMSPVLYLVLSIPSYFVYPEVYILAFAPYFLLSMTIFYSSMTFRNYKFSDIYHGTILGLVSFPILMKSAFYGLVGKKVPFIVTTKGKREKLSLSQLWPYHLMLLVLFTAIGFGIWRLSEGQNPYAISINMFWCVYHVFIISHIFYFNKAQRVK